MRWPSLLLLACCLNLSSCDVIKKVFRKKEVTQTTTTNESTQQRRTQINEDWSRIGSSLFHRNGVLWIEFDGITQIDVGPDQQIRAIGANPIIHGSTAETRRDTTAEVRHTTTRIEEDSTGSATKKEKAKVLTKEKDREQKSQKIAPILVLGILMIIALLYAAKQFKLF